MKTAFVTGITGQDGYYLAKLLLEKDYEVHGTVRRSSLINTFRIDSLISEYGDNQLKLHYSDLLDSASLNNLISEISPDEIYNLAAQSHVSVSFKNPVYTTQVGNLGSIAILEAVRHHKKDIKFYQASSSEMFGGAAKEVLNEDSPFDPKSPYAASKVFAHNMTKLYRDSYDLFCVNGILFNHESPMRGETFVTRKITRGLARIIAGIDKKLYLGNLDAKRDWGYAKDFVEAMWLILQQEGPDDYVIATGQTWSVKDFLDKAFSVVNMDWKDYVEFDERYLRPTEVDLLIGDTTKAKEKLGWVAKTSFDDLVKIMVESDLKKYNVLDKI